MSGETQDQVSGWTTDTLKSYIEARHQDLRIALDERYAYQQKSADERFAMQMDAANERYATQTKATDAAFVAQQTAMKTAFDAADKAVQAALAAAEKAATLAREAADKRFDSVNEFRAQLADQAATLLSRVEYQAQHGSVLEKLDLINGRLAELDKRVATEASQTAGAQSVTGTGYESTALAAATKSARISQAIAVAAMFLAVLGPVLVALLLH